MNQISRSNNVAENSEFIMQEFKKIRNIFLNINTQYKRLQYLKLNSLNHLNSKTIELGERFDISRQNEHAILKPVKCTMSFNSLSQYLSIMFRETENQILIMNYVKELLTSNTGAVVNIMQTNFWKLKVESVNFLNKFYP